MLFEPSLRVGAGAFLRVDGRGERMLKMVNVAIADVVVGDRCRKSPGDVSELAESIRRIGLVHPIILRPDMQLICGFRRLEACRRLEHADIRAIVSDDWDDIHAALQAERDENTCRKALTPLEMVAMKRLLAPIEKAAAKERKCEGQKSGGKARHQLGANSAPSSSDPKDRAKEHLRTRNKSRVRVARAIGVGHNTLRKMDAVASAAEADPSLLPLAEKMDKGELTPHAAYRAIKKGPKENEPKRKQRISFDLTSQAAQKIRDASDKLHGQLDKPTHSISIVNAQQSERDLWALIKKHLSTE